MAPPETTRRLATILAADVVGYSRLMAEDEEATVRTLRAHREIIDRLVARHDGRIFHTAGDSVLAEFGSAVEAVRCAMTIQDELRVRNAELPEGRRMLFRIGINLGDVIVDGDDLLGDGVNVAARLESIAPPGGVCISGGTFEQVKNKLSVGFEDLGPQTVKNIPDPVAAFRITGAPVTVSAATQAASKRRRSPASALAAGSVLVVLAVVAIWLLRPQVPVTPHPDLGETKPVSPPSPPPAAPAESPTTAPVEVTGKASSEPPEPPVTADKPPVKPTPSSAPKTSAASESPAKSATQPPSEKAVTEPPSVVSSASTEPVPSPDPSDAKPAPAPPSTPATRPSAPPPEVVASLPKPPSELEKAMPPGPPPISTRDLLANEIAALVSGRTIRGTRRGDGRPFTIDLLEGGRGLLSEPRGGTESGTTRRTCGTWRVEDGQFCMHFRGFNNGKEACPTILRQGAKLSAQRQDGEALDWTFSRDPDLAGRLSGDPSSMTSSDMCADEIAALVNGRRIVGRVPHNDRPFVVELEAGGVAQVTVNRPDGSLLFSESGRWWTEDYRFCMRYTKFGKGQDMCPRFLAAAGERIAMTKGDGTPLSWTLDR